VEPGPNFVASMDIDGMKEIALTLMQQPSKLNAADNFASSEEVLGLSAQEFEADLESNVRQLLLNAVSELSAEALNALPGSVTKNESACALLKSILIKEFAPTADILMETVVSKDYKKWLDTLKVEGGGSVKHRQQFEKLHERFSEVLNGDITAAVVQSVCRDVVSADELFNMVRTRADNLARLSEANKLSEVTSDEDPPLEGTASFGEDTF